MTVKPKLRQSHVCQTPTSLTLSSPTGLDTQGVSVWPYNGSSTESTELFLCASQRLQQGSHRPAEAEGAVLYSAKSSYALLMFYSLSAMCSCVRLCFFTTRLHCQSASLIGCEDNNTVIFTLTLQSSRNRRGEKREEVALWTFNIINTPKTNQAKTEEKETKEIPDFCHHVMTTRIYKRGKKDTLWWENRAKVWA